MVNAAAGSFYVHFAFATRNADAAARGASKDRPCNLPEVQAAARGLTARRARQIGHLDAPAGGLEIDVELLRNGNQVTHLEVSPFVSPVAGPSRIQFRPYLDGIAVLGEFPL